MGEPLHEVQEALALAENMRRLADLVEARGRIVQDFSSLCEEHEVFKDRIVALEAQLAEAREWMYHNMGCPKHAGGRGPNCTCGLDAWLAAHGDTTGEPKA